MAAVLGDSGPARDLAGRWRRIDRLLVTGRGLAYAAALETALKVKETTGILAAGISVADLRHGPIAAAYAGAPVLLVAGGGPADADLDELRDLLASREAQTASLPVPPGLSEPGPGDHGDRPRPAARPRAGPGPRHRPRRPRAPDQGHRHHLTGQPGRRQAVAPASAAGKGCCDSPYRPQP